MEVETTRTVSPRVYAVLASALSKCTFLPACADKRFALAMARMAERDKDVIYTPKQKAHILRLIHKYRRQIPVIFLMMAQDQAELEAC